MPVSSGWRFPTPDPDVLNVASRVELPEAGGWIYQLRNGSMYSTVFVPNMQLWADTIADSIAAPKNLPVAIFSNLAAARDLPQPIPT